MNIIKTKTFELALNTKGDPSSSRLAIILPGRLDTKDYVNNTSLLEYLSAHGFFAISFDPPGTWESPGSLALFTTTNYIQSVNEVIEYFGNKPTALIGHSRGGTVAMLVGTENSYVTHIIAIFSSSGAPSAPTTEERLVEGQVISYRDLPPGNIVTIEQKKFLLPLNYFEDGKQHNPLPALKTCLKPKLFFYALKDDATQEKDIKTSYEISAEPKALQQINTVHDYRYDPKAMKEINESIGLFLCKQI